MTTFRLDHEGFGDFLCSAGVEAEMRRRAEKVKAAAEASAPVDVADGDPHPGRYKASFRVVSGVRPGRSRRAYAMVINDSPEALFVEKGTKNNPRRRILGRALEAAKG